MWSSYRVSLDHTPVTTPKKKVRGRLGVKLSVGVLVVLTLATMGFSIATAAPSPAPPIPKVALPPPKVYGPPGQRFEMTFLSKPDTCLRDGQCGLEVGCGNSLSCTWSSIGVISRRTWTADDQFVWIWNLTTPLTSKEKSELFSQFLPFAYRSTFEGLPAMRELTPCATPAGSCPGYVSDIEVLDGYTMYVMSTTGFDLPTTEALLDSFHIIG